MLYRLKHRSPFEVKVLSCVRLFATPWTVAHQAYPGKNTGMWTQVSHIAGRCFNLWATREAPTLWLKALKTANSPIILIRFFQMAIIFQFSFWLTSSALK